MNVPNGPSVQCVKFQVFQLEVFGAQISDQDPGLKFSMVFMSSFLSEI